MRQRTEEEVPMPIEVSPSVEGHVSPGFEKVRDAFADNLARRGELGGACCAYHRGEKVVDLWGGLRNAKRKSPGTSRRW